MNQRTAPSSRLRIYLYALLALFVAIGGAAAFVATGWYLQRQALLKPAQPTVKQVLPEFVIDPEEELRVKFIKAHTGPNGRVLILPTPPEQAQLDPKLLEGIAAEDAYQPVPLARVPVQYTETQFQQERETWYRKYFVDEYQRAGHRDPKWDAAAVQFLDESGRRVAVTRFRQQRHSRFHAEQFDDAHAAAGQALLELGCKDVLVRSLLVEELHRQGKDKEAAVLADRLQSEFGPSKYSEFVQYQVAKSLIGTYQSKELLGRYTKHYRRSLASQTFTDLERRILYQEGSSILAPVHWDVLPEFALSLEFQSNVDPWLRNMLLGDFYGTLALDSSMLASSWYPYHTKLQTETETIREIHLNHLRRAYRYYLQAYQAQPDLPEGPMRLLPLSFDQSFTAVVMFQLPEEERRLPRMSEASPRFWFDQAVAAQFDYLPIYRQYRVGRLPDQRSDDWTQYADLIDFGRECLDSERFDTPIPLGFYDAVHTAIQHNEYVNLPASPRNRWAYSNKDLLKPFERLVAGYTGQLTDYQIDFFRSLVVGMRWIQGDRDRAVKDFLAMQTTIRYTAFEEIYQDIVEILRKAEGREPPPPEIPNIAKMDVIAGIPDSKRLLFVSGGNLGAWDVEQRRFVDKHSYAADASGGTPQGSFSDGVRYATISAPPKLQICDSKNLQPVAELTFPEPVANHRLSRNGKSIAVLIGNRVEVWDVAEKKVNQSIPLDGRELPRDEIGRQLPGLIVRNFTFSEGDRFLAFVVGPMYQAPAANVDWYEGSAVSRANRLIVWDLQERKAVYDNHPFSPNITSLRFSESGSHLMVAGTDWTKAVFQDYPFIETRQLHSIKKFDPRKPDEVQTYIGHREWLWAPTEFGADKSLLVAVGQHEFLAWDAASGAEVTSIYPLPGQIRLFTAPRQTNQIVTVNALGQMNVYADDLRSGVHSILVAPDFVTELQTREIVVDRDSRRVALRSQDTGGLVWQYEENGRALGRCWRDAGAGETTAHAFSADLKWLATTPIEERAGMGTAGGAPAEISIWSMGENKVMRKLRGCSSAVVCAQFAPDGRLLAAGLRDGNLLVWDLNSNSDEPANTYREHQATIRSLKFSADNRYLVTGGQAGVALGKRFPPSIRIWQIDSENAELEMQRKLEFAEPAAENSGVQWLDISADGSAILASCGQETSLFSFDGQRKVIVPGFLGAIKPDGTAFVTAGGQSGNNSFSLWQADGKWVRDFRGGHRESISALSFTPDGAAILSASPSEGLAAWLTDTGNRLLYVSDLFQAE